MGRAVAALAALWLAWGVAHAQPRVAATTPDLASLVEAVAGGAVRIDSLAPAGGDAEAFEPRPAHLALVRDAALVVRVGLGYDEWLDRLVAQAGHARLRRAPRRRAPLCRSRQPSPTRQPSPRPLPSPVHRRSPLCRPPSRRCHHPLPCRRLSRNRRRRCPPPPTRPATRRNGSRRTARQRAGAGASPPARGPTGRIALAAAARRSRTRRGACRTARRGGRSGKRT